MMMTQMIRSHDRNDPRHPHDVVMQLKRHYFSMMKKMMTSIVLTFGKQLDLSYSLLVFDRKRRIVRILIIIQANNERRVLLVTSYVMDRPQKIIEN
jgi:hypothetical protein